jgi:Flp pilus assembly protein TadD
VLLWDPRHLDEAIGEYTQFAAEQPNDVVVQRQLARLLAQDPRRNAEAVALYAKVLGRTPGDRAMRLEYARALARDPSRRAEALEQLRAANVERADRSTRVLYADLLAGREETREEALAEYRTLLAERPQESSLRLKYAHLLGARRETSRAAIAEYERILALEPTNGEAHAGLAQGLAWNGENDRALHHGRLAQKYGTRSHAGEVRELEQSLREGREPTLGGGFGAILQPGTAFALYGFRAPARARMDPSAFATVWAEAGVEHYWGVTAGAGAKASTATGAFAGVESELRLSRTLRANAGVGYRSLRPGATGVSALAGLEHRTEAYGVGARLERRPRFDSYLALASGVTENQLSVRYDRRLGAWRAWIAPAVALVEGGSGALNSGFEIDGGAELELMARDSWQLLIGYGAHGVHYASDGSRSASGGYFSPAFHAVQTPRLTVRHAIERRHWIEVSGGPGLQYQLLHSGAAGFLPGGEARATARVWFGESLEWTASGSFARMGDAFSRFEAATSLAYVF